MMICHLVLNHITNLKFRKSIVMIEKKIENTKEDFDTKSREVFLVIDRRRMKEETTEKNFFRDLVTWVSMTNMIVLLVKDILNKSQFF